LQGQRQLQLQLQQSQLQQYQQRQQQQRSSSSSSGSSSSSSSSSSSNGCANNYSSSNNSNNGSSNSSGWLRDASPRHTRHNTDTQPRRLYVQLWRVPRRPWRGSRRGGLLHGRRRGSCLRPCCHLSARLASCACSAHPRPVRGCGAGADGGFSRPGTAGACRRGDGQGRGCANTAATATTTATAAGARRSSRRHGSTHQVPGCRSLQRRFHKHLRGVSSDSMHDSWLTRNPLAFTQGGGGGGGPPHSDTPAIRTVHADVPCDRVTQYSS
jgi:hypothetical protein